jgi:hypothetical protein
MSWLIQTTSERVCENNDVIKPGTDLEGETKVAEYAEIAPNPGCAELLPVWWTV